jgi:hypothetical protein
VAALLLAVLATPASAQGRGRGLGQTKNHGAAPHDGPPDDPALPGTGLRQFGVWLDDATISPSGRGWATFGVGYSRAPFARQWDLPSVDAGIGMTPRTQVAVTAPVSRIRYEDGTSLKGLGDVYLALKVGVRDPTAAGRTFGVAVVPVLEFLSSGSVPEGEGRVSWALPVAVEKRFARFRTYGAVGYFSRGAAFASGAIEVPVAPKVTATGVLSHTRSLEDDPRSDASGLSRTRWDAGAGAVYFLGENATLFASLGRTVSRVDANGSSLSVGGGVSLGFQRPVRGR